MNKITAYHILRAVAKAMRDEPEAKGTEPWQQRAWKSGGNFHPVYLAAQEHFKEALK